MAFSNIVLSAGLKSDGRAFEYGTFNGAAVTTGTITAGSGTNFPANTPKVSEIQQHSQSSDGDDAALVPALDGASDELKLTFASGDTGKYYIEGPSAGV